MTNVLEIGVMEMWLVEYYFILKQLITHAEITFFYMVLHRKSYHKSDTYLSAIEQISFWKLFETFYTAYENYILNKTCSTVIIKKIVNIYVWRWAHLNY